MYLLLSGEGPSDIGVCNTGVSNCDRANFIEGPMTIIVDQLVELFQGFEMSHLETDRVGFVSEAFLASNKQPVRRKKMALRGKKRPVETKYFYENARALAVAAKIKSDAIDDKVVAVLFRDSDGTASAGRGDWQDKRDSMIEGFRSEAYEYAVAMMPKPKSEAWLLCATKPNKYQHCSSLENESGNDRGQNPLKRQLSNSLNENSRRSDLNQLLIDKGIDVTKIDMPSYNAFKVDLKNAVKRASGVI